MMITIQPNARRRWNDLIRRLRLKSEMNLLKELRKKLKNAQFKDNTTRWVQLSDLKASFPVQMQTDQEITHRCDYLLE